MFIYPYYNIRFGKYYKCLFTLFLCIIGVRVSNLVPSAMCQQFRQETLEAAFNRGFRGDETIVHDDGDSLITSTVSLLCKHDHLWILLYILAL